MKTKLPESIRRQAGLVLVLSIVFAMTSPAGAEETSRDRMADLLKERIDVLEQLVSLRKQEYAEGLSPFDPIVRAMDQLAEAKLVVTNDPAARLAIRKEGVDRWKDFEKLASERFEAALTSEGDLLQAKAAYLKARLLLLEEKANNKK